MTESPRDVRHAHSRRMAAANPRSRIALKSASEVSSTTPEHRVEFVDRQAVARRACPPDGCRRPGPARRPRSVTGRCVAAGSDTPVRGSRPAPGRRTTRPARDGRRPPTRPGCGAAARRRGSPGTRRRPPGRRRRRVRPARPRGSSGVTARAGRSRRGGRRELSRQVAGPDAGPVVAGEQAVDRHVPGEPRGMQPAPRPTSASRLAGSSTTAASASAQICGS